MSTHTVAEAKNQLSKLIDRALRGEGIVTFPPQSVIKPAGAARLSNPNFAHVLTEASEKTLYSLLLQSCNLPDFH
jgi:hypothetical protein